MAGPVVDLHLPNGLGVLVQHLQGVLAACATTEALDDLAVDAQAQDSSGYFVILRDHRLLGLQLATAWCVSTTTAGWQQVRC